MAYTRQVCYTAVIVSLIAAIPIALQTRRVAQLEQQLEKQAKAMERTVPHNMLTHARTGSHPNQDSDGISRSDVARAQAMPMGPLRRATLVEMGYRMAEDDLDAALEALETIVDESDRREFLQGFFSYAAEHEEVREVLSLADGLEEADRAVALLATVSAWTSGRVDENGKAENLIQRFGLEAGLGIALAWDEEFRPDVGDAWAETFSDIDGKAVMLGSFAFAQLRGNPEAAFALGDHLRGYDHELFQLTIIDAWAANDPSGAWGWVRNNLDSVDGAPAGVIWKAMGQLARSDLAGAKTAFESLSDPDHRYMAAKGIAGMIAEQEGTFAAVEWADSLATESDKDAAHSVIARSAPQGIGAALGLKEGFVEVTGLIPNGAADRDGEMQPGDRIVAVDPGTGDYESLYGKADMNRALELIRGESGSTVRLRVVRPDGEGGGLVDRIIELQREQIILPGATETEEVTSES